MKERYLVTLNGEEYNLAEISNIRQTKYGAYDGHLDTCRAGNENYVD